MKRFLLTLALIISFAGLNAQSIGSYKVVTYNGYELQYTVKSISPAECIVACVNLTAEEAIPVIPIPETMEIEGSQFAVTTIAKEGFSYCYSARKFELPNSLTTIGEKAFYYCNLATEIAIPENVTSIGNSAFYGCPITEAIIPSGVTKIGNAVFWRCTELTNVELPNGITHIGNFAFKDCSRLSEIELPESLVEINDNAFSGCTSLSLVICHATTPPAANKLFYNVPENMIIRVPAESIESYKASEAWGKYDIRAIGTEGIEENVESMRIYPNPADNTIQVSSEEIINEVEVYNINGQQMKVEWRHTSSSNLVIYVTDLNSGVYFIKIETNNGETIRKFIKK